MNLNISLIPYGALAKAVVAIMPYIEESAERSRGRSSVDDILKFLFTGQMALWVVYDEDDLEAHGHFITEVKKYPQFSMLVIHYAAMLSNKMEQIEYLMQEYAQDYAVKAGCSGIEFVGRPGWKKHATKYGYQAQSVTYQKFFN
jgi:hypothetical protein